MVGPLKFFYTTVYTTMSIEPLWYSTYHRPEHAALKIKAGFFLQGRLETLTGSGEGSGFLHSHLPTQSFEEALVETYTTS